MRSSPLGSDRRRRPGQPGGGGGGTAAQGAQIIDINMGCPARKVCRRAAGSRPLADERLVQDILTAVVAAVMYRSP